MSFIIGIKRRIHRLYYGLDTPKEFTLLYFDRIIKALSGKNPGFYVREKRRKFLHRDYYRFKDVMLPALSGEAEEFFFWYIFLDTFYSYMYRNDRFDEENFNFCDKFLPEGLYGLVNDKVNVTVRPGDIVIDAGSWIGDFAAYAASARKASVYAFEPSGKLFVELQKTARLNPGIVPVNYALGDSHQTGSDIVAGVDFRSEGETFRVTTIDDFVRENNLPRVDFIKSDIEGFERRMLAGAQETLARFAPKLALCTYHLPDDPQVMAELIKQANPKYNIVQKRKKLFASVPE